MNKKEIVISLMKTIETKSKDPLGFINVEKFIHHTVRKEDGFKGIWDFLMAAPGTSTVDPVRVIQDGDYVFLHTDFNFYGPHIGFDVFRFEDGRIVEMWDCIQAKVKPYPNGHTMIDGATGIKDFDKTKTNKMIVENFVSDILINGKTGKIEGYYSNNQFTEHNRYFDNPITGLTEAVKGGLKYNTIHKVLGEGNFVLTISEGQLLDQHTAFFDLFRVEEDKIVEHWDVIEPIAPKDQWKNTTGRF